MKSTMLSFSAATVLLAVSATDQNGDYQHYMKQYAGDYSKYMHQGNGQQSNATAVELSSQGGNYQQYMQKDAGDYSKYMHQGGNQSDSAQGGGYQHYMKQYAGDYSKYMQQGGSQSGSQGSGGAQGGNYQQYMDKYASDYSKYMKQGAGGQGANSTEFSAQAGDYSKYIKQYAGNYTSNGNNMTSQEAMDKYAGAYVAHVHNTSSSKEWAAAYMKQYAGDYQKYGNSTHENMTKQEALQKYASDYMHIPDNASDGTEWAAKFQTKYAGAYKQYMKNDEQAPPCSAADECKTVADLEAWQTHQKKQIHAYVPEAYREGADAAVDKEFQANKVRVLNITVVNNTADAIATYNSTADSRAQSQDKVVESGAKANDTAAANTADSSSSSWPFVLATASNSAQPQQLPEQAQSRIPAMLGAAITLSAIGAFVATRHNKDRLELEGYTDLEGQP